MINISNYESIFILRPNLTDEEVEKAITKMKGVIEKSGGEIINTENWKKRRLAYEVAKEKKGVYIVLQFKGDGKSINELERAYKIDDSVIKYLSIKLDGIKPKAAKEAVPEEKKEV